MKYFQLKLFLLLKGIPEGTSGLQELLNRFGLTDRFEAQHLIQGVPWADAAREWLEQLRNQAIAEFTLIGTTVAMLAATVAAVTAVL
jgi:hypothetical protein